jgi:methane monooxygenase PmoA-like
VSALLARVGVARVAGAGLSLSALAGAPAGAQHALAPPHVDVVANEALRRVDVTVDGKPFTSYIYPASLKKPILYPLRTARGTVVTRGWPLEPRAGERVDHPHQVGVWFTYGAVNGLDFWNNSDAIPSARASHMGTIVHRTVRRTESGAGEGTLEVAADWVDAHGTVLLREATRLVFHADTGLRAVDRITTLTALRDPVSFADDKEGLLGMRVARALEQPATTSAVFTDDAGHGTSVPILDTAGVTGQYRTSEGVEGDAVWGTRARWCMLSGVVEGAPVTIAILDHPGNVGFPTFWHARGYGLFAANPLGRNAFTNGKEQLNFHLEPGASATFRYRILILAHAATPEEIEAAYREFAR